MTNIDIDNYALKTYVGGLLESYSTTLQINQIFSDLIGTAPANLNTLQELAFVLSNTEDSVSAMFSSLSNKANSSDLNNFYDKTYISSNFTTTLDLNSLLSSYGESLG